VAPRGLNIGASPNLGKVEMRPHIEILEDKICLTGPVLFNAPDQFIAKLYAEALGRIPDPAGFTWAEQHTIPTIAGLDVEAHAVYGSIEYANDGYDHAAEVLTLYRGLLSREPDIGGFTNWLSTLNNGILLSSIVDTFVESTEFTNLATEILSSVQSSYGFGNAFPIGIGPMMDEAMLQAELNSGDMVTLTTETLVRLTTPLTIPTSTTLVGAGLREASMPRLVRDANFNGPMVVCYGTMEGIWLDGESGQLGTNVASAESNLESLGGIIQDCVFTNQVGPTAISVGTQQQHPGGDVFRNNLITQWIPAHDGIQVYCPNAAVYFNSVVDSSDAAYALFADADVAQRSRVSGNVAFNAGNKGVVSFVASPVRPNGTGDMIGGSIDSNYAWTSSRTTVDMGYALGAYEWYGPEQSLLLAGLSLAANAIAPGAVFRGQYFIAISGMVHVTVVSNLGTGFVYNNSMLGSPQSPTGNIAAVSAGWASFDYSDLQYLDFSLANVNF